jgi:hypothetical protein
MLTKGERIRKLMMLMVKYVPGHCHTRNIDILAIMLFADTIVSLFHYTKKHYTNHDVLLLSLQTATKQS